MYYVVEKNPTSSLKMALMKRRQKKHSKLTFSDDSLSSFHLESPWEC